jgi:hypothetical protein
MASVTGKVFEIHVEADYGWARIQREDDGVIEKVFLWSEVLEDYIPPQRILHGLWLAMLRDALAHDLTVDASGPDFEPITSLSVRR